MASLHLFHALAVTTNHNSICPAPQLTAQELVFGILLSNDQLITLLRPKQYSLHPSGPPPTPVPVFLCSLVPCSLFPLFVPLYTRSLVPLFPPPSVGSSFSAIVASSSTCFLLLSLSSCYCSHTQANCVPDIHLIFNLVMGSTAFRTGESWMPLCLPKFNNSGVFSNTYMHRCPSSCFITATPVLSMVAVSV